MAINRNAQSLKLCAHLLDLPFSSKIPSCRLDQRYALASSNQALLLSKHDHYTSSMRLIDQPTAMKTWTLFFSWAMPGLR